MNAVRVLIADSSPSIRAVLRRIVEGVEGLEVAGEARHGDEAVLRTRELHPDAVVMDADLVVADGRSASEEILAQYGTPIVLIAAGRDHDRLVATFRTLSKGVVAVFAKPTVPQQWRAMADTLGQTLEQIARNRLLGSNGGEPRVVDGWGQNIRRVVVGASTGGPRALVEMLSQLDRGFPAAVAIVQHIAPGFEGALVHWLATESGLDVALANDGETFGPGCIRLAQAGCHLTVDHRDRLRLDSKIPPHNGHRPSIDVLFRSLVNPEARATAGILLSGMGSDGTLGLNELKAAGAVTIAQNQPTAAIWGMPRIAVEIGAADLVMSPVAIGRFLMEAAGGSG